jgi:hypothetical protein
MNIEEIVEYLKTKKRVCFYYETPDGTGSVQIRECEDFDYIEYGTEVEDGDMFEIGPTKSSDDIIQTSLKFEDMYAAGRPILKRLAEDDGIFWDSD